MEAAAISPGCSAPGMVSVNIENVAINWFHQLCCGGGQTLPLSKK